jgi:hypothetical protein
MSLPWGLYQYNTLPRGIKPTTDIFQERMRILFLDMAVAVVYMDDTVMFGYEGFDEHLIDVAEVLRRLEEPGFQVNPGKCICLPLQ